MAAQSVMMGGVSNPVSTSDFVATVLSLIFLLPRRFMSYLFRLSPANYSKHDHGSEEVLTTDNPDGVD